MRTSARIRLFASLVVALSAGAIAAIRVAPLGPVLDISVRHVFDMESQDVFDVTISARGGEVIDEVRIEALRGALRVAPPGYTQNLAPGVRYKARVNVSGSTEVPPAVRVLQKGRVERSYDVELLEQTQ